MCKRFLLNWQISVCLLVGSLAEIQLGYSWSSFISSFSYRLENIWLHNQNYGGFFHTAPLYVLWISCVWIFSYFQKANVYDLADAQIFFQYPVSVLTVIFWLSQCWTGKLLTQWSFHKILDAFFLFFSTTKFHAGIL